MLGPQNLARGDIKEAYNLSLKPSHQLWSMYYF